MQKSTNVVADGLVEIGTIDYDYVNGVATKDRENVRGTSTPEEGELQVGEV